LFIISYLQAQKTIRILWKDYGSKKQLIGKIHFSFLFYLQRRYLW